MYCVGLATYVNVWMGLCVRRIGTVKVKRHYGYVVIVVNPIYAFLQIIVTHKKKQTEKLYKKSQVI